MYVQRSPVFIDVSGNLSEELEHKQFSTVFSGVSSNSGVGSLKYWRLQAAETVGISSL